MSVSVCLSVRFHISKTTCANSQNFLYMLVMLPVAVTQSFSVLPVLWIMYMSEHGEDSVIEYHDVYFSLAGVA